jgi:chromosomal replication initiator protein
LLQLQPKAKVAYIHGQDYLRSVMNAARNNTFDALKQKYKQYDLLILDDVQFIADKTRTMEEFFYLFNHFYNERKQIILTSDELPENIDGMDVRLKTRFSQGLTMRLEPPEFEMRVAILQKKAQLAGVKLEEDAAFFIAKHIQGSVRYLEGAFKRVEASSRFTGKPINIDLATHALKDLVASAYKVITTEMIMEAVAGYYKIGIGDLTGKKRTRNIARPRQMAMMLTKELTNLSLPAIGSSFGGRDHTTVMHAVKTIADLRKESPDTERDYQKLLILIKN